MKRFLILFLVTALFLPACTSSSTSTTSPTTTNAAASVTDTFSGTIAQTANATFPFTVTATGTVQVTLTSVSPLATMALGVAVMSYDGTSCGTSLASNDNARTGATALTGIVSANSYCVKVYDSGNIPDSSSATYTVQVAHP